MLRPLTDRCSRHFSPRPLPAAGILFCALLLTACSPKNLHPDIAGRARAIHVIGIVRPDVSIYSLSAGGQLELVEEWSEAGRNNLLTAVVKRFSRRATKLQVVQADEGTEALLEEVRPLAAAISATVSGQSYLDAPPFDRHRRFVHSVGSLGGEPERNGVDALLLMTAYDEISSYGRRALIAVGKITGLLFGEPPRKGATVITMMLLDRDGAVLWYAELREPGAFDLRSSGSAAKAAAQVLESFPGDIR